MATYNLCRKIGEGGFADVWLATDQATGLEVALKMLRDFGNREARHHFVREVRMLTGLRHRYLMCIIEANVDAQQPFYVMPLMRGGALTPWAGQLPDTSIATLMDQFAEFLAFLHGRGALHRDFKPDNLLVDAQGNVTIGDLGLGNDPRYTVKMTANAFGTLGYMAPELVAGGQASAASDIYAFGATVFHLMTGVHPKDAGCLDPWVFRPETPHRQRDLVVRMVNQNPKLRPTASQILVALRGQKPTTAGPRPDLHEVIQALAVFVGAVLLVIGMVYAVRALAKSK